MNSTSLPTRNPSLHPSYLLVLAALIAYTLLGDSWLEHAGLGTMPRALVGIALMWLLTLGVLVVVRRVERRSWESIGLHSVNRQSVLLALGVGLLLMLLVPLLSVAAAALLPTAVTAEGGVAHAAASPWWLLLLGIATAAVCEEVLFRAYPIERLGRVGAALGLGTFVLIHAGSWNVVHVLGVVLPLGAALTALYLWRRELWFVVIVHAVIDVPLVILALIR